MAGCPPTKPSEQAGRAEQVRESSGTEQNAEDILAEVNGETLTRQAFESRLDQLPDYARARYGTAERRKTYLDNLVRFELLADVAERRGHGQSPEVFEAMKAVIAEQTIREAVRRDLSLDSISEQAVEAAYEEGGERYREPERRRVAVLATDRKSWAATLRERVLEKGRGDKQVIIDSFRKTASNFSLHTESAPEGGAIGWVVGPEHDPERPAVSEVVFEVDERGQISAPFRVGDQWWLALWFERSPARRQSLEQVSRDIRQRLYEQRRESLRDRLLEQWRQSARVDVDRQALEALEAPEKPRLTRPDQIPLETTHEVASPESGGGPRDSSK